MKVLIAALLLASSTVGYAKCHEPTCDTRAQLAFDYMFQRFGETDSALSVWLDHSYGSEGKLYLERRENRFEKLEQWARTSLTGEDKEAYLAAINAYEDGAKEAYSEWHTHETERKQQEYERHLKECAEATRKSKAAKPMPKPPEELLSKRGTEH